MVRRDCRDEWIGRVGAYFESHQGLRYGHQRGYHCLSGLDKQSSESILFLAAMIFRPMVFACLLVCRVGLAGDQPITNGVAPRSAAQRKHGDSHGPLPDARWTRANARSASIPTSIPINLDASALSKKGWREISLRIAPPFKAGH